MVAVLESHLSLLEREAADPSGTDVAERAGFIEDLILLHLAVLEGMERHLSRGLLDRGRPFHGAVVSKIDAHRPIHDCHGAI